MSEWQPIETAPKDGTHILLHAEGFVIEAWWDAKYHHYDYKKQNDTMGRWDIASLNPHGCGCCGTYMEQPAHWMPLPPPPTTPEGK